MNQPTDSARDPARARRFTRALLSLSFALCWPVSAQSPGAATGAEPVQAPGSPSMQQQKEAMARDAKRTGAGAMSLGERALEGAKGTFRGFGEAFRETRDDFKRRKQEGFLNGPGSKPDEDRVNF